MITPMNLPKLQSKDLRMVCFHSWKEFLERPFFPEDEDLKGFSYQIGPCAIIVPVRAVPLLKKKGLKFDVLEPTTESDLTSEQNKALKNNKAILYSYGDVSFFMERSRYLNRKRVSP